MPRRIWLPAAASELAACGGARLLVYSCVIGEALAQFRQRQRALLAEGVDVLGPKSGCSHQATVEANLTVVAGGVPEESGKG
jgi:hypothetical protein